MKNYLRVWYSNKAILLMFETPKELEKVLAHAKRLNAHKLVSYAQTEKEFIPIIGEPWMPSHEKAWREYQV